MKKFLSVFVCLMLSVCLFAFAACSDTSSGTGGSSSSGSGDGSSSGSGISGVSSSEVTELDGGDMFTNADKTPEYDEEGKTVITLSGETATVEGDGASVESGFINVTAAGTYYFTGSAVNLTIRVDCGDDDKVRIVLSGVTIENESYAPLYVKNADKTFVILEGENSLAVTGSFVQTDDNTVDGAIFSKDDIVIQGDGKLTVESQKHGIVGKDDVKITGGEITVTAKNHGVEASDSIRISGANLTVNSGKDGLHAETDDTEKGYVYIESGTITLTAGYDGIDASGTVQIDGGAVTITAGGGSVNGVSDNSTKGVKSDSFVAINGGTVTVDSGDDSVHSNASVKISGGILDLKSGDDGVHADDSLIVTGGTVTVGKSYEGLEGQNVNISGGKISVIASDDGINAAGGNDGSSVSGRPGQNNFNANSDCFIAISGGEIYINAGGDGIDSNGNFIVSGGYTVVEGPTSDGDGALDYDGAAEVTGGTLIAIGSSGMAMNFQTATQGAILLTVGSQKAGSEIKVTDGDGNEVISFVATKAYASVAVTAAGLESGETYTVSAGSYSATVTLTSLVYGSSSGMGGGAPGSGGFGGNGGAGAPGGNAPGGRR